MNSNSLDWDAVRIFLAVAEHRSLSRAAQELRLSQPTLGRHIARLEEQLDIQLFDRRQSGYVLTEGGKRLVEAAQSMARGAADFGRAVDLEKASAPDQVCRVTLGEWGQYFLSQHVDRIVDGLPGIRLEFYADDAFWDLTRNSADIAIGNQQPKQANLITQKLGDRGFHVYASENYCRNHEDAANPASWPGQIWVGYCGTRARLRSSRILQGILKDRPCRYSVNSSVSLINILHAGHAMGVLPDWIGENEGLVRLSAAPLATSSAWLNFHERLRLHPKLSEVKNRITQLYKHRYAETTDRLERSRPDF